MTEKLVFVDVETTGLDPHEGHLLLEISARVVEPTYPFFPASPKLDSKAPEGFHIEEFHAVVKQNLCEAMGIANGYVHDMHQNTGLWDKIEAGIPVEEVDAAFRQWLEQYLEPREGRIAGNSIRLDMNFMEYFLPQSMEYLHYRSLDISGLAYYVHEQFGIPYYEKKLAHTASEDLDESLSELIHITEALNVEVK